jgi:hypothetical protein
MGYVKERDHHKDMGVGGKVILKCILKWDKGMRYLFVWLVIVTNY